MRVHAAVLDASITSTWLLPDEASDAAREAYVKMRRGVLVLHAPETWLWQCGNIIVNAFRHGRLAAEDALLTWSVLDAIRSRVELTQPQPAQVRAALALALDHALSLHGAAYLWLAMSLRLPLLTSDDALANAARDSGVRVIGLAEVV